MKNIVLIGMPGAGKSTIGVILAKVLGFGFLDTDLIIQEEEQRLLKDIIEEEGLEAFIAIEDKINCSINVKNTVIAPGGSVVYGENAMKHLREIGIVVYIKLSYKSLKKRLGNIRNRGVVLQKGQNLKKLYHKRCPLYENYAHITLDVEKMNIDEAMEAIMEAVMKYEKASKK